MPSGRAAAERPVVQRVNIKQENGKYYPPAHPTGAVYDTATAPNDQKEKITRNLAGDPDLIQSIQEEWGLRMDGVGPVARALFTGSQARLRATALYDASQDKDADIKTLLNAQKKWQDYLVQTGIPKEAIFSVHRSFGLEYEFANWELTDEGEDVPSHTEVGKSAPFSSLLGVPFTLETDAAKELEIVSPPLLAGQAAGGIDKAFIKSVHEKMIAGLVNLRENSEAATIRDEDFEDMGLGKNWAWGPAAARLKIKTGDNEKWGHKANQIGYQLNLAMKAPELAAQVNAGGAGGIEGHQTAYENALAKLRNRARAVGAGAGDRAAALAPVFTLFAKGLSNFVAIPTIAYAAQDHVAVDHVNDLHSHVKDLHAFWIKDSVQNTVMSALEAAGQQARDDMYAMVRDEAMHHPMKALANEVPEYGMGPHLRDQKENVKTAIGNCLTQLTERLAAAGYARVNTPKVNFLEEDLTSGRGVRQDTFANLRASNSGQMHLAEFRSNEKTDAFLG
ncbi:hypothetical protein EDB95_2985 [Dinghuibacter silviterrae]|uniref:Uncharacterized protein n=2 Tax=Dinghuibacter silviterrae TaxID=1539049 RepID=A0A4R8DVI7_9BACT|nr:hypothetical protein EDB95_2985 [Dinghuibacter silviterrae]